MKAALGRSWDTILFVIGLILVLALPMYLTTLGLAKIGLPSPAQLAGAGSTHS